jgi:hypothetical protein
MDHKIIFVFSSFTKELLEGAMLCADRVRREKHFGLKKSYDPVKNKATVEFFHENMFELTELVVMMVSMLAHLGLAKDHLTEIRIEIDMTRVFAHHFEHYMGTISYGRAVTVVSETEQTGSEAESNFHGQLTFRLTLENWAIVVDIMREFCKYADPILPWARMAKRTATVLDLKENENKSITRRELTEMIKDCLWHMSRNM